MPTDSTWSWVATQSLGTGVGSAVADGVATSDRWSGVAVTATGVNRRQAGVGPSSRELAGQDERDAHHGEGQREDEPAGAAGVQWSRLTASGRGRGHPVDRQPAEQDAREDAEQGTPATLSPSARRPTPDRSTSAGSASGSRMYM